MKTVPLPIIDTILYRHHGILICGDNAIHENVHFSSDIRSHPVFSSIFGRITCSYIEKLMTDLITKSLTLIPYSNY